MSVDRLSVTVPSELGAALRALAEERGTTVSTVVAQAISHEIRLAALDQALAEADRRFGAVAEDVVGRAQKDLTRNARTASTRARRRG